MHSLLKMTVPNRHSKQKKLQTIRISRKQKLPKTLKNRLPSWFPLGVLKLPVTALAEAAPQAGGRNTCTGAVASSQHTIAVDPRVIPYGTRVMINGVVYIAEDKGGGVKGHHIDIFYDTHAESKNHGIQNVEVFLLS